MAYQPWNYQQYYQPPMADQLAQLRQNQYQYQYQPMASMTPNTTQPSQQYQAPPVSQPQAQSGIIWVPNEQAANEYIVAPNNAVALWNSNEPVIYLKQADASGKPHMTIYDLVERNSAPVQRTMPAEEYVTKQELNAIAAKLEAQEAKLEALTKERAVTPKVSARKTVKEDAE